MLIKLILLLITLAFVELAILIKLGTIIGTGKTILIIILTSFLGVYLAKLAGINTIYRILTEIENRQIPKDELLNGLCIILGGGLLIFPGIITDTIGFLLLIPMTRNIIKDILKNKMKKIIREGNFIFLYRR
ncbi:MAG: FxsA family protein [Clostridiales bacterium]|nr:FxsA family protein [Clostridiales bacterium]